MEIGGQTVKAGEGLIMANDIGNRDPRVFADPDRLDLTREARNHVAFGFGVHQCLGQSLARMELQVVYGTLYKRDPDARAGAADIAEVPFKHDALGLRRLRAARHLVAPVGGRRRRSPRRPRSRL